MNKQTIVASGNGVKQLLSTELLYIEIVRFVGNKSQWLRNMVSFYRCTYSVQLPAGMLNTTFNFWLSLVKFFFL